MTMEVRGSEPKLEAPGAGLPYLQEWLLKYVAFPLLRRVITWEQALHLFEREGTKALALVREAPEALRTRQVLVPRMMGIEDSSRYWSMHMTLEHILIVSGGVVGLMTRLSSGEPIATVVNTADVKPGTKPNDNIERQFAIFMTRFRRQIEAGVSARKTSRCHVHPWFGCLNPHGWMVMLAVHQWIHKRQLRAILKRLPAAAA